MKRAVAWWLVCMGWVLPSVQAQTWVPFTPSWGPMVQAADASALNKPLEAADALSVVGAQFKRVGRDLRPGTADDTRVRLFGVNLTHEAAFPAPEQAREVAQTLRSMGFNAVRLHHLDTLPTSDPAVFRSTLTEAAYPSLHAGAVARLKTFIDELKQQGLYINLNLMVGYAFRPQIDGVPALDDAGTSPGLGSAVHVFHPVLVARQIEHARKLLAALGLKDNPALAQVEIINESSLAGTWLDWDRNTWTRQIRGPYAVELERQWQQWLKQRHGSLAVACQHWQTRTCDVTDLALLTPEEADKLQGGATPGLWRKLTQKGREWLAKTWPASRADASAALPDLTAIHPKVLDTLQFVAEVDRRFVQTLRQTVHDATRPTLPVTGTQVNFGAPLTFVSHAGMDYVDAHFYVDHPEFPGGTWSDTDWRIRNRPMSGGELENLLALATHRDPQRPFVVSEFNQPYPSTWGHEVLALTAAVAALQDWDGLYFFDYTLRHDARVTPHNFNLQGDWPKLSTVGMAAHLFRDGRLAPLTPNLALPAPDAALWFSAATDRRPDTWVRHVQQRLHVPLETAVRQRVGLQPKGPSVTSGAGGGSPLTYAPADRLTTLNTPTHQLILGQSSGAAHTTVGSVTLDTPQPDEPLALWLMSLDGLPVPESKHLLLALPTPVVGSLPGARPARPVALVPYRHATDWSTLEPAVGSGNVPSGSRTAQGPLWLRRDVRQLHLSHPAAQLVVYPLQPNGSRRAPLPPEMVSSAAGQHHIRLNATPAQTALWFELTAP
ncbi:capsular biosynthesis protein [Hydrogenophaga soli]